MERAAMPLIQCKLGPTTQNACGTDYVFERDAHGRYVARVDNLKARALFLAVEHYVEAPEVPDDEAEKPKRGRRASNPAVTGLGLNPFPSAEPPLPADADEDEGDEGEAETGADSVETAPPNAAEKPKRGRRPAAPEA